MTSGRSLWGEPGSSLQTPSPATSRPARFLPAEVRVALAAVTSAGWHVPQTCWSPCGTRGLPCLVALGSGARARQGQLPETEAILATFHQKRARRRKRGVRRAPGGVEGASPGCGPTSARPRLLLGVMMPAAGATALSWAVALPGAAAKATGRRGPVAPACHVAGAHHSPPRDSRAGESARRVQPPRSGRTRRDAGARSASRP